MTDIMTDITTHLQNHDYDDILRTYCGKSNYDIYVDHEEWTDDIALVDCNECLIAAGHAMDNIMTPEEKIAKKLDAMRRRMADTLRDEIKSLYENADPDDEAFDELLAEISDLLERYQGIL